MTRMTAKQMVEEAVASIDFEPFTSIDVDRIIKEKHPKYDNSYPTTAQYIKAIPNVAVHTPKSVHDITYYKKVDNNVS